MTERIDKSMGNFIKWDKCNESVMGKSFRMGIKVDITRPLKRGITLKLGEKMIKKILFKYERLGSLCFLCKCLDHLMKE